MVFLLVAALAGDAVVEGMGVNSDVGRSSIQDVAENLEDEVTETITEVVNTTTLGGGATTGNRDNSPSVGNIVYR